MCYICVGNNKLFAFPGRTITASQGDVDKATSYLHTLGFSGLTFEDHPEDNWIRLQFKDYNQFILDKTFGMRKKAPKGRVQWVVPGLGAIYVNEKRKRVLIQNIEQVERKKPSKPLPPVDIPPFNPNVDDKVFATPQLIDRYKKIQVSGSPSERHAFMKTIWNYWNEKKFHGQMDEPTLSFLKDAGMKMRKRGLWRHGGIPHVRELLITPRLFNARFDVFAEIFLHEMCHQAVSEIDKVRERTNQGHGPKWAAWMRKVGLEPNRYDKNDNIEYMNPREREAHEGKQAELDKMRSDLVPLKQRPYASNTVPVPATYVSDRRAAAMDGYLIFNPRKPMITNFISDEELREGSSSGRFRWSLIKPGFTNMIFERRTPEKDTSRLALNKLYVRLGGLPPYPDSQKPNLAPGTDPNTIQLPPPAGLYQRPNHCEPAALSIQGGGEVDGYVFYDPATPSMYSFITDDEAHKARRSEEPDLTRVAKWSTVAPSKGKFVRRTALTHGDLLGVVRELAEQLHQSGRPRVVTEHPVGLQETAVPMPKPNSGPVYCARIPAGESTPVNGYVFYNAQKPTQYCFASLEQIAEAREPNGKFMFNALLGKPTFYQPTEKEFPGDREYMDEIVERIKRNAEHMGARGNARFKMGRR